MKLMSLEMKNFKGLCGKIDFHKDVTAVIGYSAASGKTALVEALLLLQRIMAGRTYEKGVDLVAEGTELTVEFETSYGRLAYFVQFGSEAGSSGNVWEDHREKEMVIRNERITFGRKTIEADSGVYTGYPLLPAGVTKWKFGTLRKKLLEPEWVNMLVAHRKCSSYILSRYLTEKAPKGPESEVLCQAALAIAEARNFTHARIALGNRTLQSQLLKAPGQPHWRVIHAPDEDTPGSVLSKEEALRLQEEIRKVNPILKHTVGASMAVTYVLWNDTQRVVNTIKVTASNGHEMPLEECPPSLAAMVRLVWYLACPFKGETIIVDDLDLGLPEDLFRDIVACLAGRENSGQVIFTCRSLAPLDLCDEGKLDIRSIRTASTLDPESVFNVPCFSKRGASLRLQHRKWWTDNDGKELKELLTAGN